MKVPHLNEFLRRARDLGVLDSILVDFGPAKVSYCKRSLVSVESSRNDGVRFIDERGDSWTWGLSGSSMEIVRLKSSLVSGILSRGKVVLVLGRATGPRGDARG